MAAKRTQGKPATGRFSLGGEQAEADPLLASGFYESAAYATLRDPDDPRCFFVGRTGAGKSALMQKIEEEFPGHTIRISPEDLSLPYITDLHAVKYLTELGVHLDPLFIALWKHVLLIEVIKNRFKIDSPTAKQNFLQTLIAKISRDKSKMAALEYLEDFEGKFWCETDERVREITTRFESQIQAEASGSLGVSAARGNAGSSATDTNMIETRSEQADRFQRVVNETQLPRLNQMIKVLDEDILESAHNYTYIIIDDLDRDWVDEKVANALIRCLFRAVVDLKRVRNLKIVVALRTNIFEALDFGSRTGGQEEKFRSLTYQIKWTPREIEELLGERARAAARKHSVEGVGAISDLLPATNKTRGSALDFILRRTLMRPRDSIAYFNECFNVSAGRSKVTWDVIHQAELEYSQKRLLALRDEWKPNYPGLDSVTECFRGSSVLIAPDEMEHRLEGVALLLADPSFAGSVWLTGLVEDVWNSGADDSWRDSYFPVIRLLFQIGFLGLSSASHKNQTFNSDVPTLLSSAKVLHEASAFLVHPTFRAALEIRHP